MLPAYVDRARLGRHAESDEHEVSGNDRSCETVPLNASGYGPASRVCNAWRVVYAAM